MIYKRLKINRRKGRRGRYNITSVRLNCHDSFLQKNNKLGPCDCSDCAMYFDNIPNAALYMRTVLKYKKRIASP